MDCEFPLLFLFPKVFETETPLLLIFPNVSETENPLEKMNKSGRARLAVWGNVWEHPCGDQSVWPSPPPERAPPLSGHEPPTPPSTRRTHSTATKRETLTPNG